MAARTKERNGIIERKGKIKTQNKCERFKSYTARDICSFSSVLFSKNYCVGVLE